MGRPNTLEDVLNRCTWRGECLEWNGCKVRGYGQVSLGCKTVRVHRVVFEHAHGILPPGVVVCHRCDNPSCCNLEHLFIGTHADNVRDRQAKNRQHKKVSDSNIAEMRRLRAQGLKLKELALMFGLTHWYVGHVLHGHYRQ